MVVVQKQDGQCHDGKQTQEVVKKMTLVVPELIKIQGLLIPDLTESDTIKADQATWVLVIEKEASMRASLSFTVADKYRLSSTLLLRQTPGLTYASKGLLSQ